MNHNTKKKAREYDSPLIQSLLAEITSEEHERTVYQMRMSIRIEDGIIAKGWNKGEFAKKMGKNPSEVSKWLSGSHNFTLDTLTDIQRVLGVQLLCAEEVKPVEKMVTMIKFQPLYINSNTNQQKQHLG